MLFIVQFSKLSTFVMCMDIAARISSAVSVSNLRQINLANSKNISSVSHFELHKVLSCICVTEKQVNTLAPVFFFLSFCLIQVCFTFCPCLS